jgi:hypothetical protein
MDNASVGLTRRFVMASTLKFVLIARSVILSTGVEIAAQTVGNKIA